MLVDHECMRLSALRQYDVLDSPPEEDFDRITALAARLFDAEIACITLVDQGRFYFKSTFGVDVKETARRPGFCSTAIESDDVYCIEDARADPFYDDHPMVIQPPHIRFYAGSALRTDDGFAIGTLCLMDSSCQAFGDAEKKLLRELAEFVMFHLDRRKWLLDSKKREESIRNVQKLESLGLLASGVAHDFNNLLVGVLGNASLASHQIGQDEPAQDAIADIVHAANQAVKLTDQLLAYAGQRTTSPSPIDLKHMLAEMAPLLRSSVSANSLIEVDVEDGLNQIVGDLTQLRQVVLNLVTNASESYGGKSGRIHIRLGKFHVDNPELSGAIIGDLTSANYVALEVEDDGCGMDDETLSSLFSPFFTTKISGRGLGMSIVQRIVRTHDGFIHVESSFNRGCNVMVILPTGDGKRRAPEEGQSNVRPLKSGSGTVLVVDDDELVLKITTSAVKSFGFDVICATDGNQAVRKLQCETDISAIVLDATMPGMTGAATLEEVRKSRPHLPTVITSGHHVDEISFQFSEFDKLTFLHKPWTIEALSGALREALSK